MLEAPAARVYAKALEVTRRNHALELREDAAHRRLEVSEGPHHVTLSVASLSDRVSQLMIVATVLPGEASDIGRVVNAVLRVCHELRKLHRAALSPASAATERVLGYRVSGLGEAG